MIDRQQRGNVLMDANARGNEQAYALAQQGMGLEERGQLRTLAGQTYQHGMGIAPSLLVPGGMPTPTEVAPLAATGNALAQQSENARAVQALGAGAQHAAEGGVDPLAMPGMPQTRITPTSIRAAGVRGDADAGRFTVTGNSQGGVDVRQQLPRGATPEQAAEAGDRIQAAQRQRNAQTMAQQALRSNPHLRARVEREEGAARARGAVAVRTEADANSISITAQHRDGRTQTRRFDRRTGEPLER
jgi:hypothetical protein